MPLCESEITESQLDGTSEIGVVVPKPVAELRAARNLVRTKVVPRILGHIGLLCFVVGVCAWVVSLVEGLSVSNDVREL